MLLCRQHMRVPAPVAPPSGLAGELLYTSPSPTCERGRKLCLCRAQLLALMKGRLFWGGYPHEDQRQPRTTACYITAALTRLFYAIKSAGDLPSASPCPAQPTRPLSCAASGDDSKWQLSSRKSTAVPPHCPLLYVSRACTLPKSACPAAHLAHSSCQS